MNKRELVGFKQSSSIIKRFKQFVFLLAIFMLLEFLGMWFSSRTYLDSLAQLNQFNHLTGMASRSATSVTSGLEILETALARPMDPGARNIPGFTQTQRQANTLLKNALSQTPANQGSYKRLLMAQNALETFNLKGQEILATLPTQNPKNIERLRADFLIAAQFEKDAQESLRLAQVEFRHSSDKIFSSVYEMRFMPLLISFALSLSMFFVVLFIGLSITKHLQISLKNLLEATDQVAKGNFGLRVNVLVNDEIGRLTFSFNQMIKSVRESSKRALTSASRTARLQQMTADFSRALDTRSVAEVVVRQGVEEFKADAGAIMVVSEDQKYFEFVSTIGYPQKIVEQWKRFPLESDIPIATAVKENRAIFLETKEEITHLYPHLNQFDHRLAGAMIAVPLSANERLLGALSFKFDKPRTFSQEEKDFALALGALSAQAYLRAALYDDAKRAIKIRDEFLSIASHELKTPLTALKLRLQLTIKMMKAAAITSLPDISSVLNQVDRLNSLIEELLDVSRIESGKLTYNFESLDLFTLVNKVLEHFGEAFKVGGTSIEVEGQPTFVNCDRFRLEQVLINLLSNAVKYGQGKPIKVYVRQADNFVYLSVRDQGIGIPQEKHGLIFNRFERAINPKNTTGLGLGLYISKKIIEAHHGRIFVESEPGYGSTFTLELPIRQAIAAG